MKLGRIVETRIIVYKYFMDKTRTVSLFVLSACGCTSKVQSGVDSVGRRTLGKTYPVPYRLIIAVV